MMPRDLNALSLERLFDTLLPTKVLRRECARILAEDIGTGDATSRLTIPTRLRGAARIVAREACVVAGLDAVAFLATSGRRDLLFAERTRDGARVKPGTTVAIVEGRLRDLLTVERSMLNLLARMSGIATMSAAFVDRIRSTCRGAARPLLLDTRKTTPGLRLFEKYAVRAGGGTLHRIGLFDAVLVKDNHLAAIESMPTRASERSQRNGRVGMRATAPGALDRLRRMLERLGPARRRFRFVEIEVDRLDQLDEILRWPKGLVDIVLLDNMKPRQLRRAVERRDRLRSPILLEASGGVRLETIATIARSGVDRISAGAITHAARSIDFSLDIEPLPQAMARGGTLRR